MKIFENAFYDVLPMDSFRLFTDLKNAGFPEKDSKKGRMLIEEADKALCEPVPQLYASVYRLFSINGNRTEYQNLYYKRRELLIKLLLGEIVLNENKYTDKIIDIVWLILEESSWVIPAHCINRDYESIALPEDFDDDVYYIDLFSAETASMLAFVYYFMKDKFEAAVPKIINNRILHMIKQRVLQPFFKYDHLHWMGLYGQRVNNWNPWIISNVLISMALTESDLSVRSSIFHKALACLDFYIDGIKEDGGCDEGPFYWNEAAACVFDCLEIIYDLTGGKANYFNVPVIRNMFDYIRKVHITGNYYAAFADSQARLYQNGLIAAIRMGERTDNFALSEFATSVAEDKYPVCGRFNLYRNIKDLCYKMSDYQGFVPSKFDFLKNLQVAVIRKKRCSIAAKGGNNNESHNHNDIGNFILFANDMPLMIDIGRPTYTKDVFGEKRYTVFPINSKWHNLPIINGFGQKDGDEFKADSFTANEDIIRIEYQSAYEKEAGAKKCVREITVSDTEVTLHESISYEGEEIIFNYYLATEPVQNDNVFIFESGAKIICPENFECYVEKVTFNDEEIAEFWNTDVLYRLGIKAADDGDIELSLIVKSGEETV